MANKKERSVEEKTSVPQNFAEKLFHVEYYIDRLLDLHNTEAEIGCEVKDDCHIDFSDNGKTHYIQLKHTIKLKSNDETLNLTDKDDDLWHTISNWIDLICDETVLRSNKHDQLKFISNSYFELVTNKQISTKTFNEILINLKEDVIKIEDAREKIKNLIGEKSSEVDMYIDKLLQKDNEWISDFLKAIKITHCSFDSLQKSIFKKIEKLFLKGPDIQNVYDAFYVKQKDRIYKQAASKKIITDRTEFMKVFQDCVDKFRTLKKYTYSELDDIIPDADKADIDNKNFIRQLSDIKAIDDENDKHKIAIFKYRAFNSYSRWRTDDVDLDNSVKFDEENQTKWNNTFKKIYTYGTVAKLNAANANDKEDLLIELGQLCLGKLRDHLLKYSDQPLDTQLSNGHFYLLSDKFSIGYRFDWKVKYNVPE